MDTTHKEQIALAKKKLRKFQQKSARLEKNVNGSQENDCESQISQLSDVTLHQQTIDILVEEKAELMRTRDSQTSEIQQLRDQVSVLKSQLHSTNSDYTFSEKKRNTLQNQLNNSQAEIKELSDEKNKLATQVSSLNEQLTVLQTEVSSLMLERSELNERLSSVSISQTQIQNDMSSVPNPFKRNDDVIKLEGDVKRLTEELESVRNALVAKESQCDTLAGRLSHQDTLAKQRIAVLEEDLRNRDEEMKALQESFSKQAPQVDEVKQIDDHREEDMKNKPISEEDTSLPCEEVPPTLASTQSEDGERGQLAELQRQKEKLVTALEEQMMESIRLQRELDKFKETHVDQATLLTQLNNDKATISRAMGQNKQLKDHMIELQDKLMKTSDTNAALANEVQELSSKISSLMLELVEARDQITRLQDEKNSVQPSEDSILEDTSSRVQVQHLHDQIKDQKETIARIQQEKAILGLSAAQVDSVKAMNIALQEKVASLTSVAGPRSEREVELEDQVDRLERQYQPEAVEKRIQDMLTSERLEREKQREFLDRYYEEQLREQIGTLEDRISVQTKQFKQYVTDIQTSHEDEVEALRSQLSELQQNFRSSLQTQYNQLVHYFTNKGASDLKAREEELHSHYMAELSRLYSEMTKEVQKEAQEIRQRKRTQSDEFSVITVDDKEETQVWEEERECLKSTLQQLEEEIVKIEAGAESDTEEEEESSTVLEETQTKAERKLKAHVRVLEMQLSRATEEHERTTQRYKQEIVRQSAVIQKLHMYLATQHYDTASESDRLRSDSAISLPGLNGSLQDGDDSVSLTSAGQFQRAGDLSATKDKEGVRDECGEDTASCKDMKEGMESTEQEFETKLKDLAAKGSESGEYLRHMQKLQMKFANVMKDNADLLEKLKDMEYQNVLLEGETDTIGEYISLYQSQRRALQMKFQQKDDFINKLLNERSEMQAHITRLQLLISDLPCIIDEPGSQHHASGRQRSDSITSTTSALSIMSTTRDEMLEIIGKLRLRTNQIPPDMVTGPVYSGNRGPVQNM